MQKLFEQVYLESEVLESLAIIENKVIDLVESVHLLRSFKEDAHSDTFFKVTNNIYLLNDYLRKNLEFLGQENRKVENIFKTIAEKNPNYVIYKSDTTAIRVYELIEFLRKTLNYFYILRQNNMNNSTALENIDKCIRSVMELKNYFDNLASYFL